MKKIYLFIVTLLVVFSSSLQAQVVDDDTEITVTNEKGENETFDLPEAMTSEIDSLLHLYNTKTYLKRDADCNLPNVNKTYEPDVYKDRLRRLPTIMEMPYNNVVQKFIDRYSNELRNAVGIMLGASNFYMPIFEQALETYNLPLELKYLPVIESGLNPKAVSRVGATGLWQFMLATAKNYGLEINSLLDERCDPIKSSYAAANYLSDLYRIFGDWNLVIAAYNCGPEKLTQAIHRAGGSKDYWKIYPYLPRETRGYVPAFIAANYIMNYYCEHNICPVKTTLPPTSDTLHVSRNVRLDRVEQVCGVPLDELKALNPQYRTNMVPGEVRPCILRLPGDKVNAFIEAGDSIYVQPEEQKNVVEVAVRDTKSRDSRQSRGVYAKVRRGDTLGAIARRNHTTVNKIKRLNKMRSTRINPGQRLRVK